MREPRYWYSKDGGKPPNYCNIFFPFPMEGRVELVVSSTSLLDRYSAKCRLPLQVGSDVLHELLAAAVEPSAT